MELWESFLSGVKGPSGASKTHPYTSLFVFCLPLFPPPPPLLSLAGSHMPRMTLNAASASRVLWLQMCTTTRGFRACMGGTLGLHICVGRSSPTEPYRQFTSILLCSTEKSLGIKR